MIYKRKTTSIKNRRKEKQIGPCVIQDPWERLITYKAQENPIETWKIYETPFKTYKKLALKGGDRLRPNIVHVFFEKQPPAWKYYI